MRYDNLFKVNPWTYKFPYLSLTFIAPQIASNRLTYPNESELFFVLSFSSLNTKIFYFTLKINTY